MHSDTADGNDSRTRLLDVSRNLTKKDLPFMKLLLSDFIDSDFSTITDVKLLFKSLEIEGHITLEKDEVDINVLTDCLYHMRQMKLLHKLGVSKRQKEEELRVRSSRISPYRRMLYKLAVSVRKQDMDDMKYLLQDDFTRAELDEKTNSADLMILLEIYGFVSEYDVDSLKILFEKLTNKKLVKCIVEYEDSLSRVAENGTSPHGSDSDSSSNFAVHSKSAKIKSEDDISMNSSTSSETIGSTNEAGPSGAASLSRSEEDVRSLTIPTTVFDVDHRTEASGAAAAAASSSKSDAKVEDEKVSEPIVKTVPEIPVYSMLRQPRGLCLVICNYDFTDVDGLEDRIGSKVDLENIQYLFESLLHFNVEVVENLTAAEISFTTRKYAVMVDHSKYDCFACFILSHGELGCVYGIDGKPVKIRDITYLYSGAPCPTLRGKPKMFFIQACQGINAQIAIDIKSDSNADDMQETIPNESDFLFAYSTLPGYRSFRNPKFGSWFVVKLVEVFESNYQRLDLLTMLTMVNNEVSELATKEGKGHVAMCPAPQYTLRKQVKFSDML